MSSAAVSASIAWEKRGRCDSVASRRSSGYLTAWRRRETNTCAACVCTRADSVRCDCVGVDVWALMWVPVCRRKTGEEAEQQGWVCVCGGHGIVVVVVVIGGGGGGNKKKKKRSKFLHPQKIGPM